MSLPTTLPKSKVAGSAAWHLAAALRAAGVRLAFGVPGGEVLTLLEAFRQEEIRFVLTRHENSAAFMADAVNQLTGVPGVCVATVGPGATNMITGVCNSLLDRSAVIAISGDVDSGVHDILTHQVLDLHALFQPVSKWSVTLQAANTDRVARKAIAVALADNPGPVHINLPADVAAAQVEASGSLEPISLPAPSLPGPAVIASVMERIAVARNPVVLVGLRAAAPSVVPALLRFCETWNTPVFTTYKAKGTLPEDHPLSAGAVGLSPVADPHAAAAINESDLLITIGFDMIEMRGAWLPGWRADLPVIALDTVADVNRLYNVELNLVAAIGPTLEAITPAKPRQSASEGANRAARVKNTVMTAMRPSDGSFGPYAAISTIRARCPRDTILTLDSGSHRIAASHLWQAYTPRSVLQSNGLCTMGYAVPAATAAKLVCPGRPVVAMLGDGGLAMGLGDLTVLADQKLPVVVVVFVDSALSLIRLKQQRMNYPGLGVDLACYDYPKVAEALGGRGFHVTSTAELEAAIDSALSLDCFSLVAVEIDAEEYKLQM